METERFTHFISRIFTTENLELDCNLVQTYLPALVEAEATAAETGAVGVAMHGHFQQCPDCAESYRALIYVVDYESEHGLPEEDTLLEDWSERKGLVS